MRAVMKPAIDAVPNIESFCVRPDRLDAANSPISRIPGIRTPCPRPPSIRVEPGIVRQLRPRADDGPLHPHEDVGALRGCRQLKFLKPKLLFRNNNGPNAGN